MIDYFILCEDSSAGRCLSISRQAHAIEPGQVEISFSAPYADFTVIQAKVKCAKVYYNGSAIVDRVPLGLSASKSSIVADGIDASVVSGIPTGAQVSIWSEDREDLVLAADGTNLFVSSNDAVDLKVFVKLWPYVTSSIEVQVVSA